MSTGSAPRWQDRSISTLLDGLTDTGIVVVLVAVGLLLALGTAMLHTAAVHDLQHQRCKDFAASAGTFGDTTAAAATC